MERLPELSGTTIRSYAGHASLLYFFYLFCERSRSFRSIPARATTAISQPSPSFHGVALGTPYPPLPCGSMCFGVAHGVSVWWVGGDVAPFFTFRGGTFLPSVLSTTLKKDINYVVDNHESHNTPHPQTTAHPSLEGWFLSPMSAVFP